MSTILKALRRLEQEKSTQTDRPLSDAVANTPPPAPVRRLSPWIVAAGSIVAAFLVTVGAFWLFRSESPDASREVVAAVQTPDASVNGAAAAPALPPPGERTNADRIRAARLLQEQRRVRASAGAAVEPHPQALASEVEVVDRAPVAPAEDAEIETPPPPVRLARQEPPRPGLRAMRPRRRDSIPSASAAPNRMRTDPLLAPDAPAPRLIAPAVDDAAPELAGAPAEPTPTPATAARVDTAPPEPVVEAPEPAAVAALQPEPAPVVKPVAPAAPKAEPPAPAPKTASSRKPAPPRSLAPDVYVERTEWHPLAERRVAFVEYGGSGEAVELREGDVIGSLVVGEIEPTGVHFMHDGSDLRRRVGER